MCRRALVYVCEYFVFIITVNLMGRPTCQFMVLKMTRDVEFSEIFWDNTYVYWKQNVRGSLLYVSLAVLPPLPYVLVLVLRFRSLNCPFHLIRFRYSEEVWLLLYTIFFCFCQLVQNTRMKFDEVRGVLKCRGRHVTGGTAHWTPQTGCQVMWLSYALCRGYPRLEPVPLQAVCVFPPCPLTCETSLNYAVTYCCYRPYCSRPGFAEKDVIIWVVNFVRADPSDRAV